MVAPYLKPDRASDRNCSRFSTSDRELHPIDFEDIELTRSAERNGWTELEALVNGTLSIRIDAYVTVRWTMTIATRS